MKSKAIFYHAGCPVCISAEQAIVPALDKSLCEVEVVHLGQQKTRIIDAEKSGVKSVPALVLDCSVLHINHGADLSALK